MPEAISGAWLGPVLTAPFVGSFLGVLVLRLPASEPVLFGRSACRHCREVLGPRDLIPLASWLASRGGCRHCGAALGPFYPAIEIAAILVALWAATQLSGGLLWAGCALGWTLLVLALVDARHFLLPDALTLPLVPAGLAVALLSAPETLPDRLIGVGAGFAAFAAVAWGYRRLRGAEGLGRGDVKLLSAAGAWTGWQGLPSVVLLAALGGLAAALLRAGTAGRLDWRAQLPFGPFLCAALWLVWLYGPIGGG